MAAAEEEEDVVGCGVEELRAPGVGDKAVPGGGVGGEGIAV